MQPHKSNNVVPFTIYQLSEQAVSMEFGKEISEATFGNLSQFRRKLHSHPFDGFIDSVQAYTTLSVFYDPVKVSQSAGLVGAGCYYRVSAYLSSLYAEPCSHENSTYPIVTIPICYGGALGPDLNEVAQLNNQTPEEVIKLHSTAVYKVFMIGFIPGFAYLGGLPEALATPRKTTPRQVVPAGAVGIAGKQTGIYPLSTPGGWQLIGQTPLKMFDVRRMQPSLLQAGDRVIFKPISYQEYQHYGH